MEQLTSFISSRGILRSCGSHNRHPVSSNPHLDADLLEGHRPGGTIYVCTEALNDLAEFVLPKIESPFVLVSGDSDLAVNEQRASDPRVAALLEDERLLAWHAQNMAFSHPKLHGTPIGMDYHTMSAVPGFWGLQRSTAVAQEFAMVKALADAPRFQDRYASAYCSWQHTMGSLERHECLNVVDRAACYFEPVRLPRFASWVRQTQFMFVLSPEGVGMDCHRTWEALALGCIPVVKRNAVATLLDGLPAVVVEDWRDINREMLLGEAGNLHSKKFDFSPLYREFWMRKIRSEKPFELPEMTLTEFQVSLTKPLG